MNISIDF